METHETTSTVEGTETLTLDRWIKTQTLSFFWKALSRELDIGRTYEDCVRQLQGFFKAGNGAPTGRQLRQIVNRMVQRKEVPADFLSAWDRRRGREPASTPAPDTASPSEQIVDQSSEQTEQNHEESIPSTLVAIERTEVVNGWPLAVIERDSIPLIEDEELGRRLGYADPRMVRKLVRRIFKDSELMSTVSQRGGRPATVFLLTERQALKVAMRSETHRADAIQNEIIAVYEAWLAARRTVPPATVSLDVSRLEAFFERRDAAFTSLAMSALEVATSTRTELSAAMTAMASRLTAIEERSNRPKKVRSTSKPRPAAAPAGWMSHRSVASERGLPSVGPTGKVVDMICRAAAFTDDPDLARVAPHGSFNTLTLMLSPECVGRLEPVLAAARETMRDYGYQVSKANALEPRREVRPLRSQKCVLEKMVAAALAQLVLAAAA